MQHFELCNQNELRSMNIENTALQDGVKTNQNKEDALVEETKNLNIGKNNSNPISNSYENKNEYGHTSVEQTENLHPCTSTMSDNVNINNVEDAVDAINIDEMKMELVDRNAAEAVNINVEEPKVETYDAGDSISEAGRFSLAAVCALALSYLFNEEYSADFNKKCIHSIVVHLQLPERVELMLNELIKGNLIHSAEPYIGLLHTEPFFIQINGDLEPIIRDLISLAVHDGSYDARWRVLIHHLSCQFNIDLRKVREYESTLIKCLLHHTSEQTIEEKKDERTRNIIKQTKRVFLISLAAAGGGVLIGMTGGLAAPLIGAGLSSVIGTSTVLSAISTTAGAAVVGSLFGVAGGGLTGYKMHKRVGDIEEFEFHILNPLSNSKNEKLEESSISCVKELHIAIVVSGWIKDKNEDNYTRPWLRLINSREQYYLRYESSYLLELGRAMNYFVTFVASAAAQETLKYTVLSGLVSAIAWPAGLIGLASVIDNPWGVCLRRSAQVGKQLAEILLNRNHGNRPVTLLGYSLGARVIFYCLREMSNRKSCEGIIQDVILIGAPCTGNVEDWKKFNRVVAGKIVNGYCRGDWLLRFLYRTLSVAVDGVAGLQPINLKDRRMHNIDLTDLVSGHSDYPDRMPDILSHIGVSVISPEDVS